MKRRIAGTLLLLSCPAARSACDSSPSRNISIHIGADNIVPRSCEWIGGNRGYCQERDAIDDTLISDLCPSQCQDECLSSSLNARKLGNYPDGPYITPSTNSHVITLPEPPAPTILTGNDRRNCPHKESGLKDWHNAQTWENKRVPRKGDKVVLPNNTRVIIKRNVKGTLSRIIIPKSSELIIGEKAKGIRLTVKGIEVFGKLTVGSEHCRIETPVTITLKGRRPAAFIPVPPDPVIKGISVSGGTLNLHGKRYYQTWSRLAKEVMPGDQAIVLQRPVNWEKGQQIVLVTSAMQDHRAWHRNEVHTVAGIEPSPPADAGAIVYLEKPVEFGHEANNHYQVEVGLLSRTVKVQGASDSEPSDPETYDCKMTGYPSNTIWYDMTMPCMDKETTGYGGHIMVHSGGKGYVEGVELYRMGQTNVHGRYPMHFHKLLGTCRGCYFRDNSIHRAFYRCISVHATHRTQVSENVAYDITGHCYYLEDGIEKRNTISYNLAALVHTLGRSIPSGTSQQLPLYTQSEAHIIPADISASGFYITNVRNNLIGNAASGGWAGYAFPAFPTPHGDYRYLKYRPTNEVGLTIDGNTAHSTGFWWINTGGFYLGGSHYYVGDTLQYNPGRFKPGLGRRDNRQPCQVNLCDEPFNDCEAQCPESEVAWIKMTNTKTFLIAGVGLNSWAGGFDIVGYESYDSRLPISALSAQGFWIDNMLVVCRTGNSLGLPSPANARKLEASGYYFYDTGQSQIITNTEFRNCGYRSYGAYESSPTRGCGDDIESGCYSGSTVFGMRTHSDQFVPEVMHGTKNIVFSDCGRRFKYLTYPANRVSGRGQNLIDADGSFSGFGEPTLVGPGISATLAWWKVDSEVYIDSQGPLSFVKQNTGPERMVVHLNLKYDPGLYTNVGRLYCANDGSKPCPILGRIRHLGHMFSPRKNPGFADQSLPITANPSYVGLAGGFGWLVNIDQGPPKQLIIDEVEIDPSTMLLLTITYPAGTKFTIKLEADDCTNTDNFSCSEHFYQVNSIERVRNGSGNTYHVDSDGVLTFRVFMPPRKFIGNPDFFVPDYQTNPRGTDDIKALARFEREQVILPNPSLYSRLVIEADCRSDDGIHCRDAIIDYDPDVCESNFEQVAYDKCCHKSDNTNCVYANGQVA